MNTLVLRQSIWLALVCTSLMAAAMSDELELVEKSREESQQEYVDLENPVDLETLNEEKISPDLPLVIITQQCPICFADFSKENRRIIGDKVILSACTENLPDSAEHAFHMSCIQQAYSKNGQCSLCRREINEDELETASQRRSKKIWYYSKRVAQGIPYGLAVGSGMEIINCFGTINDQQVVLPILAAVHLLVGAILYAGFRSEQQDADPVIIYFFPFIAHFLNTILAIPSRTIADMSQRIAIVMGGGLAANAVVAVGTTYIAFKGIGAVPVPKRKDFIKGVLGGILLSIVAGYGLTTAALAL